MKLFLVYLHGLDKNLVYRQLKSNTLAFEYVFLSKQVYLSFLLYLTITLFGRLHSLNL